MQIGHPGYKFNSPTATRSPSQIATPDTNSYADNMGRSRSNTPVKNDTMLTLIPVWTIPSSTDDERGDNPESDFNIKWEEEIPEEGMDAECLNLKTSRTKSFTPSYFVEEGLRRLSQNDLKQPSPTYSPVSTISTSDLESQLDQTPMEAHQRQEIPKLSLDNDALKIKVIDESFLTGEDGTASENHQVNQDPQCDTDRQKSSRRSALQVACPGFGLKGDTQDEILKALAYRRKKTFQSEIVWGTQEEDDD